LKAVICDIDGVLLQDNHLIPGAEPFVRRLRESGTPLLLLTNYPSQTPQDLQNRLRHAGIDLPVESFYTSAMATADFLRKQEGRKAFVIGEGALIHELYGIGFTLTEIEPDFVVVGETTSYNWEMIRKAAALILNGARFIATNPDEAGPEARPACGALCAPIERITGKQPFYIGKPNPWILRAAMNHLNVHSEETVIVGDNMRTDILTGVSAGIDTILVLTGVTGMADLARYPYRPTHIFPSVAEIDVI
jgi:NagD protein